MVLPSDQIAGIIPTVVAGGVAIKITEGVFGTPGQPSGGKFVRKSIKKKGKRNSPLGKYSPL